MTKNTAPGRTQTNTLWRKRISPLALQGLAWLPGFLLLRYFAHLKVSGKENIRTAIKKRHEGPRPRGVIFAINHTSELDPIVLLSGLHPFSKLMPMFYVTADRSQFAVMRNLRSRIFYHKWFFNAWGAYSITRGTRNYEEPLAPHLQLLREGASVAIFPEGKVRRDASDPLEVHGGVAYLAEHTGAVVIPVSIHNTKPYNERKFWKRNNTISIYYGAPLEIQTEVDHEHKYREKAEELMDTIYRNAPTHASD